MILSSAMVLDWLSGRANDPRLNEAARRIEDGVNAAVLAGRATPDFGGTDGTASFADAVAEQIASA